MLLRMYSSPVAGVTNYHKLAGSKTTEIYSLKFWRPESKTSIVRLRLKCGQDPTPSGGSRGRILSLPLPALEAASIPWLVAASLQSLPLSSYGLLLCMFLLFWTLTRRDLNVHVSANSPIKRMWAFSLLCLKILPALIHDSMPKPLPPVQIFVTGALHFLAAS